MKMSSKRWHYARRLCNDLLVLTMQHSLAAAAGRACCSGLHLPCLETAASQCIVHVEYILIAVQAAQRRKLLKQLSKLRYNFPCWQSPTGRMGGRAAMA